MQGPPQLVLLVEDDVRLAQAVKANLLSRGWSVDLVSTGEGVFDYLATRRPDVIVLDLRLPDMSGLSVLEGIRRLTTPPPVVLLSGFLDVRTTLAAMRHGAVEVLEKPTEPAHLARVLENAVGAERGSSDIAELVGSSPPMLVLKEHIQKVARFQDLPVLIMGESGTGKEIVASALHRLGGVQGPLVALNCAAMPEALFESELFGHTSGAFTGAKSQRKGLLEAAANGTLFLDEIGEMSPGLQSKLLRVLETRTFRSVGSNEDIPFRARVISATNRRLHGREGEVLRSDLFFRLAGYVLVTPPLRDRTTDLDALSTHFLEGFAKIHPHAPTRLSPEALDALRTHDWPGNLRELRAVLQSAVVCSNGSHVGVRDIAQALHSRVRRMSTPPPTPQSEIRPTDPSASGVRSVLTDPRIASVERADATTVRAVPQEEDGLPEVERTMILRVAEECDGNLSQAARRLKIPRSTLRDRLRRYGVR